MSCWCRNNLTGSVPDSWLERRPQLPSWRSQLKQNKEGFLMNLYAWGNRLSGELPAELLALVSKRASKRGS